MIRRCTISMTASLVNLEIQDLQSLTLIEWCLDRTCVGLVQTN